jgi:hypothetical protein
VTKFTPLTNTNQRSTLFISQLRLNKNNLFFAIELSIICVTLIFVITRFFIEHDNSKDNVVVVSAQLNGYQQFMTEPANKRQLIATLQSIRMHNVTRYQHFPWPSKHLNQNGVRQPPWPYTELPNTSIPQRLDFKIVQLEKSNKQGNAWNGVDDRHSNGYEPFDPPIKALKSVQYGW